MAKIRLSDQISGREVYNSPEFQALAKKFGIVWDLQTSDMTIHLSVDELIVTQSYRPQRPKATDTTSPHGVGYWTCEPPIQIDAAQVIKEINKPD